MSTKQPKKSAFIEAFKEGYEKQKNENEKDTATNWEKVRGGFSDGVVEVVLSPWRIFQRFWK